MEVADQWRRQWAGTAEYGKVTEGGVTRRVARAMEVLHASGPGARVRVMRAAYHSSAGPGAPAESFMLHSSRRVISSGFNFLEPPSLPTKPLEISSTPLEITLDSNGETENYKVTEPDDLEISEPSKWRGSTRGSSIRMPSEESSSTDNASIIDLDSRNRNLHRKYSYDSESSDIQFRSRSNSRNSQLLDAPTTLSTLKYKSLLNSSNEWNTRRKSYSFEDTSPLNESIIHNNATLAMESSTDSGICKSTEIVNDRIDDNSHIKHFDNDKRKTGDTEGSFRDWLSKNRQNSPYKGTKFKTYRDHDIVIEDPKENNIALQSSGKLSITLPITIEGDCDSNSRKLLFQTSEDIDRRVKKVEFCKTEVHFAAESGKVNIIATDDKPPPSSDFRKRRSAFVPLQDMTDRPITLFGEKPNFIIPSGVPTSLNHSNSDYSESDENTTATKSILKNKIPKPKPYLLGENMDFGISNEVANTSKAVLSAVSLVNQQMESEKRYKDEIKSVFSKEAEKTVINHNIFRTIDTGPTKHDSLKREKHIVTNIKIEKARDDTTNDVTNKLISLKGSPTQVKPKTRHLRESDLTYFGIDNSRKVQENRIKPVVDREFTSDKIVENIFHSVKLIQQVSNSVSNSVCNSEPESDDGHAYENIPLNINHAPVPTPRLRTKYEDNSNEIAVVKAGLKPIIEKEDDEMRDNVKPSTRRTKVRRQEEYKSNRSLSEPPKNFKRNSHERSSRREGLKSSCTKDKLKEDNSIEFPIAYNKKSEKDVPIYANLNMDTIKASPSPNRKHTKTSVTRKTSPTKNKSENNTVESIAHKFEHRSDTGTDSSSRIKHSMNKDTVSSSLKKEEKALRSERNRKSQYNDTLKKLNENLSNTKNMKSRENNIKSEENNKSERYSRISQNTTSEKPKTNLGYIMHRDSSTHGKRNTSEDKKVHDNRKPSLKLDSDSTERYSSQIKSNEREKEFGSKHQHRSNKHREYVINYDDKNGTVSSICKIKTGLGTPRRKKTSKEMSKENHKDDALKTKTVDKLALRNAVGRSSGGSKGTEKR